MIQEKKRRDIINRKVKQIKFWLLVLLCFFCLFAYVPVQAAANNGLVTLRVSQILEGSGKDLTNEQFTYNLETLETDNPMPIDSANGIYSFTIIGTQEETLETIQFITPGIYNYQLSLLDSKADTEFISDEEVYIITVYVISRESKAIHADIVVTNRSGAKVSEIAYTHCFNEAGTDTSGIGGTAEPYNNTNVIKRNASVPRTGDKSNLVLYLFMILFNLFVIVFLQIRRKLNKNKMET